MFAFLLQPLAKWIGIGIVIAGLGLAVYVQTLRLDNAHKDVAAIQKDLSEAVAANEANQVTIRQLHRNEQIANEITAKEIAKSSQREKSLAAIKKELKNVKGSEELMGPYFDDLADRLRALEQSPSDSTN